VAESHIDLIALQEIEICSQSLSYQCMLSNLDLITYY